MSKEIGISFIVFVPKKGGAVEIGDFCSLNT